MKAGLRWMPTSGYPSVASAIRLHVFGTSSGRRSIRITRLSTVIRNGRTGRRTSARAGTIPDSYRPVRHVSNRCAIRTAGTGPVVCHSTPNRGAIHMPCFVGEVYSSPLFNLDLIGSFFSFLSTLK